MGEPAIKTEFEGMSVDEKFDFLHELILSNQDQIIKLKKNESLLFKGLSRLENGLTDFRTEVNERFDRIENEITDRFDKVDSQLASMKTFIEKTLVDHIKTNIDEKIKKHKTEGH